MEQRWRQRQRTLLAVAGLGWLAYKVVQRGRQANLHGQVVLITGGSRGLGLALARAFARAGCRLVLTARDGQELARAQQDLWQRGAAVLAVPCDVTDQEQVHSVVDQATQRFGRVDIVVNNAGIIQVGPLSTTTKAISGKDFTMIEYACPDTPRGMGSPHSFGRSYYGYARLNAGIPSASSSVADRRFTLGSIPNDWTEKACLSG